MPDVAKNSIKEATKTLKDAINVYTGVKLDIKSDYINPNEELDPNALEILVGKTSRSESEAALGEISDGNDYIVKVSGSKIIINGKEDRDVLYGLKYFAVNYIINSPETNMLSISGDFVIFGQSETNGDILPSLATVSTAFTATVESRREKWPTYGRIIELKYNGENNGVMFATSQWANDIPSFPIYRSDDSGKTWELITQVTEQLSPKLHANWQPHLYELPNQVGDMPKGTLLLSGCTHDSSTSKTTKMCIWKSNDLGKTWKEICVVDEGKGSGNGQWEPFLICDEDGSLVCFYSDETEVSANGGQRLVFRVSKDGINWGEKQYCATPTNKRLRPGMVSVAKMGDHGYIMVYEMIDLPGLNGAIYYKTSDSLTEWDAVSEGKRITDNENSFTGTTPYCEWTPEGGPYGTIIAAGRFSVNNWWENGAESSDLYYSFDLGETWYSLRPPLNFDYKVETNANYAYSFGFFTASDGSIYYICNAFPENEKLKYDRTHLRVAKIVIDGYASYKPIEKN